MNGERIAFENWLGIKPCGAAHDLAWSAWQARASLPAPQQATPEPVGEPYGWAVTGCHSLYRGEWAEATARGEAKRCGGTARAVALYARRGAGVPEADPLQGAVDWFWQAIPNVKAHDVANRLSIGWNRASRLLAAAQAKGRE